jgi:DNA-binding XRE family transcriptional regulator
MDEHGFSWQISALATVGAICLAQFVVGQGFPPRTFLLRSGVSEVGQQTCHRENGCNTPGHRLLLHCSRESNVSQNIEFFDIRFFDLIAQPTEMPDGAGPVWVSQSKYKVVGRVLAAVRERAGLTQQELARRLTKPQSFVSNYERGQRRIDVLELLHIVEVLGGDSKKVFSEIVARQRDRR